MSQKNYGWNASASTSRCLRQMPGDCMPVISTVLYMASIQEIPVLRFQLPDSCPVSGIGSDLRRMQFLRQ